MTNPKKRNKYGNTWCIHADGTKFQSKAEMRRYGELLLLQKAGKVLDLELQPSFDLHTSGYTEEGLCEIKIGTYRADFSYSMPSGYETVDIIEDVKGFKTDLYRWKKKHVEAEHGITITEIIYK